MDYKYLPEHLRETADKVAEYFKKERGTGTFKVEAEVVKALEYRPTLHVRTKDGQYLCIDVQETPYSSILDSVVPSCMTQGIPVQFYVAFPGEIEQPNYKQLVERARKNGIGVVDIKANSVEVVHEAIPLTLLAYRPIDKQRFPAKYRAALVQAENTYRNGSPSKGCSIIYDEIEAISRTIVIRTRKKRYWRKPKPGEKPLKIDLDKGNWQVVLEVFERNFIQSKFPKLSKPLLNRIFGIIPYRNESGHKAKSLKKQKETDTQLRTRFEAAIDLLADLITAVKQLK